jgi:hypothetical protein
MGGGGTYRLGSRYPSAGARAGRPAASRATCPWGTCSPCRSTRRTALDDPVVSVLHDRGPAGAPPGLGGQVIFDETNGYGHAVWNYKEGNERGWPGKNSRCGRTRGPCATSTTPRSTAAPCAAGGRRWRSGGPPRSPPASSWRRATQPAVCRADQHRAPAPAPRRVALRPALAAAVSVNGAVPIVLPAPLPATPCSPGARRDGLSRPGRRAGLPPPHAGQRPPPLRRGAPPHRLRHAGERRRAGHAMRRPRAASGAPIPRGPDGGAAGADKVPHSQNLYGRSTPRRTPTSPTAGHGPLPPGPDRDGRQNAVVARLADSLPVRLTARPIGLQRRRHVPPAALALGLVHYNPLSRAPHLLGGLGRPRGLRRGLRHPLAHGRGRLPKRERLWRPTLLVMPLGPRRSWRSAQLRLALALGRAASRRRSCRPSAKADGILAIAVGEAVRRAAAADFALVELRRIRRLRPVTPGVTRVCDVVPFFANLPIGMFEVSGAELLGIARQAAAKDSNLLMAGLDPRGSAPRHLPGGAARGTSSGPSAPRAARPAPLLDDGPGRRRRGRALPRRGSDAVRRSEPYGGPGAPSVSVVDPPRTSCSDSAPEGQRTRILTGGLASG